MIKNFFAFSLYSVEMETALADKEQRVVKLQDQIIDMQKNDNRRNNNNNNHNNNNSVKTTTDRLGSLFIADPDAESTSSVTLPSIYPDGNSPANSARKRGSSPSSMSSMSSARRPSRIPSSTRRESANDRSRCKSRLDRPLSSNAAQQKTVEEMKVEIQVSFI